MARRGNRSRFAKRRLVLPARDQAIEDAATLILLLWTGDPDTALTRSDRLRRRRTTAIWRQSRQMGKVSQASHSLAAGFRDMLLRATPPALMVRAAQGIQRWTAQ